MALVNDFDFLVSVRLIMLTRLKLILGWHILKKTFCSSISNNLVSIAIQKRTPRACTQPLPDPSSVSWLMEMIYPGERNEPGKVGLKLSSPKCLSCGEASNTY
jgi:hypothetical protein